MMSDNEAVNMHGEDAPAPQRIKPKIAPQITVTVTQGASTFNGNYTLIALDANGNEKPGTEFNINAKGYEKLYRKDVEAAKPKFAIKKSPTQ